MLTKFILLLFVLIINTVFSEENKNDKEIRNNWIIDNLEDNLERGVSKYAGYLTRTLEKFNDENLGSSYFGNLLHYNELKPKIDEVTSSARQGRVVKRLSTAMLPLVFHVGATSTWLLLTALMTAKSVAIGLLLLVFKIAVSSAKVSAFFTTLKHKHDGHGHHDYSWNPHEHGHERGLTELDAHHSYKPDWHHSKKDDNTAIEWPSSKNVANYKTIPDSFSGALEPYGGYEYADDERKSP